MIIDKTNKEEDTSNNDTDSEESDDVTEESEETGNNVEDKSSKESSKDTEESDDEEDISKQYFTNPDSLDPKLRGAFKRMQGIFTKRMQEATTSVKKAQAFDQLVLDPEFREWMEERHNRVNGKSTSRKSSKEDDSDDDDEDDDTPMTRKALRKELQGLFKGIKEEDTQREQAISLKKEAEQFKKDNPDWEIYKEHILNILEKHPTLSYQDAYDLAAREDFKREDTKKSMESKKKANVNKPNRVVGKNVQKKGKMTVTEAFNAAKKSLGL